MMPGGGPELSGLRWSLLSLLIWLPETVHSATCREWTCTNPLLRISPTEQGVSTDQAPEASQDCANAGLQDPIDCLCGCSTPVRVSVLVLPVLVLVYAFVVAFFIFAIRWLRAKPKAEYTQLRQSQGMTKEELLDPTEPLTMRTSAWMRKPSHDVLHEHGLDAAVYLLHCEQCSKYWTAQFFVIGILLCYVYRFHGDLEFSWNMFAWSYANLAPSNNLRWAPVLTQFWFAATTLWFVKSKENTMDDYRNQAEMEGARHTALKTLLIRGILGSATEHDLVRWFERNHNGRVERDEHGVLRAKLVWDISALGHNVRLQRKLIKEVNALSIAIPRMGPKQQGTSQRKIAKLIQKLDMLRVWERPLRQRGKRAAGSAVVTFCTVEDCLKFRRALILLRSEEDTDSVEAVALGVSNWSAEFAPPRPADIYWENFRLDRNELHANHVKIMFWSLVLFAVFVCFGLAIIWTIGFLYFELLYQVYPKDSTYITYRSQYDAVGPYGWYGVGGVCIVTFLALEEQMCPMVKYLCKLDSPVTTSHKQSGYLYKIFFFYVIYHVLLTTLLFGKLVLWLEVADIDVDGVAGITSHSGRAQLFVETLGAFQQNRLFLSICVIDMLHVMGGVRFFTRKAKHLSAKQMATFQGAEDLEEEEEDLHAVEDNRFLNCKFDYTGNYGESIAAMASISCFAAMHPTIMSFGSMYFTIKYFVDKYQICNQYSRPQAQYGLRTRATTIVMLMSQLMAQYFNSFYFLVLAPSGWQDVGLLCLFSALAFTAISVAYIYKPESLKVIKDSSQMSSADDGESATESRVHVDHQQRSFRGKDLGLRYNIYSPPQPDALQVGVRLDARFPLRQQNTSYATVHAPADEQETSTSMTNALAAAIPLAATSAPAAVDAHPHLVAHPQSDHSRGRHHGVLHNRAAPMSVDSYSMISSSRPAQKAPQQAARAPARPPSHNPFNARVGGRQVDV